MPKWAINYTGKDLPSISETVTQAFSRKRTAEAAKITAVEDAAGSGWRT